MAITLPTVMHIARHVMEADQAWMLFLELPSLSQAGKVFRLVHGLKMVVANGHRWQATSMKITVPGMSVDGDFGTISVEIPNVLRVAASWVEAQDDVVGGTATIWFQHESVFGTGFIRALSWRQVVLSCEIREKKAVMQAGRRPGVLQIPKLSYDRITFPQLAGAGQGV